MNYCGSLLIRTPYTPYNWLNSIILYLQNERRISVAAVEEFAVDIMECLNFGNMLLGKGQPMTPSPHPPSQ